MEYKNIISQSEKIDIRHFDKFDLPMFGFGFGQNIDFDTRETIIDYCMQHGIKYYETAWTYENSEIIIGKILKKYPRKSFYLADKIPTACRDISNVLEIQLNRCQVEYFDFYLIHGIMTAQSLRKDMYDTLISKKKNGKIKFLGFSYHGNTDDFEVLLTKYKWDFVQLSINAIDWELNNAKKIYKLATKYNLPIITMNSLKGGQLAVLNDESRKILQNFNCQATIPSWSYRFLASFPNIVLLSRAETIEQMKENIKTFSNIKPLDDEEKKILLKAIGVYNSSGVISCTYCRYCNKCPNNIPIYKYFLMFNQYKASYVNNEINFITEYESIPENDRLDKCTNCGLCKKNCTQHLDIPNLLKNIKNIYCDLKNKNRNIGEKL